MKKLYFLNGIYLFLIAFMLFSCDVTNVRNDPKLDAKPPRQIISIDKAVAMYNIQDRVREGTINPALRKQFNDENFDDTVFAWFTLDEMRKYINYIDAIQKENPKEKVSGIRVYFGRYDKETSKKFNNQQTVFFVPTVANPGMSSKFENLNHLPFAVEPDNSNNPIKGDFVILNNLVLDTDHKKRIINYDTNQKERKQKASLNPFNIKSLFRAQVTSTILNEANLAPPPK